jgi:hypothetical protein
MIISCAPRERPSSAIPAPALRTAYGRERVRRRPDTTKGQPEPARSSAHKPRWACSSRVATTSKATTPLQRRRGHPLLTLRRLQTAASNDRQLRWGRGRLSRSEGVSTIDHRRRKRPDRIRQLVGSSPTAPRLTRDFRRRTINFGSPDSGSTVKPQRGEVRALRWRHVDLDGKTIEIRRAYTQHKVSASRRTSRPRGHPGRSQWRSAFSSSRARWPRSTTAGTTSWRP